MPEMKIMFRRTVTFLVVGIITFAAGAWAQSIVHTTEGVSGDRDKKRRNPVISVDRQIKNGNVQLLVDAHVPSEDYRKYPIRFEFYLNRRLHVTQIRSQELPGPVGIDIGPDVATLPFNYTVVARVLHPNRTFTTVLNGAAYNNELSGLLDCIFTQVSGEKEQVLTLSPANALQTGNNSFALDLRADNTSNSGGELTIRAELIANESNSTGTLIISQADIATTTPVTGVIEQTESGGPITAIEVSDSDGLTTLVCSKGIQE